MIKIQPYKLKYSAPFKINYNHKQFIFCKENIDRYNGGGYHPGRAMTLLMRLNDSKTQSEIHNINENNLVSIDEYILYPYKFNFRIHNSSNNIINANWYSGLAQGLALMAYVRYENGKYKKMCDKILNSFESDEICEKTENGFHYMEYPHHCDALNGHIYALYGIYEYWHKYQTSQSEFLFKEGVKWVKNNLYHYRNKGNVSFYCKDHKVLCDKVDGKYHKVHIEQLKYLYEITGDVWFREQANLFLEDFFVNM